MEIYSFAPGIPQRSQTVHLFFEKPYNEMRNTVDQTPEDRLATISISAYSSSLVSLFRVEPLTIYYEQLSVSDYHKALSKNHIRYNSSSKLHVIVLHLPYSGSTGIVKAISLQPGQNQQGAIQIQFTEQELLLEIVNSKQDLDWVRSEKQRIFDIVSLMVAWCNREIDEYNQSLLSLSEKLVAYRQSQVQEKNRICQENNAFLAKLAEPYIPVTILPQKEAIPVPAASNDDDWYDDYE
ncbi:hypothetical protein [Tengunoibacter tsumagoiensis]|uniref:Uncharacterized protein n=1 Tax=Tengunoibacter tsumagoiensis TaxID=2014871 RepID=A0A402A0D8_9CHLR|nr:hypothetical protein [Tengunoibacter tsumagoiensis]GCE12522.1 hypothetical protein KTT_23810 [Tengunoibacter tsumagoiensis]